MNDEIVIVGRFPPPFGGVSVYCRRRYLSLREAGEKVSFLDFGDKTFFLNFFLKYKALYEVNTLNLFVVFLFFITGRLGKAYFIDHNASRHYSGMKKSFLIFMLKFSKGIWVVNQDLQDFYPSNFDIKIISPFVPPPLNDEVSLLKAFPENVISFISTGKVMLNSAWKLIPYGESDLYGVTTSISLLDKFNNLKLLVVIGLYNEEYFDSATRKAIEKYTNENRLLLLFGEYEIWPLLRYKPICLRLTPTDGDSVTVREALFFGAPVLASDSIKRPESCYLYEYGKMESLESELRKLL